MSLAIIIVFSVFYGATAKELLDVEELRIIAYCRNYSEDNLDSMCDWVQDEVSTSVNPELKDVLFNCYQTALAEVDNIKLDVELEKKLADIYIMPSVPVHRVEIENPSSDDERYKWQFADYYWYSHQALSGRYMLFAIDEMIASEKSCGDPLRVQRAERLETLLAEYDEDELYCTYARAYIRTPYEAVVYNDLDENGNPIEKKWGINLSVLDLDRLNKYFIAEENMSLVLGFRVNSANLSDSIAYAIWLFENFEKR